MELDCSYSIREQLGQWTIDTKLRTYSQHITFKQPALPTRSSALFTFPHMCGTTLTSFSNQSTPHMCRSTLLGRNRKRKKRKDGAILGRHVTAKTGSTGKKPVLHILRHVSDHVSSSASSFPAIVDAGGSRSVCLEKDCGERAGESSLE